MKQNKREKNCTPIDDMLFHDKFKQVFQDIQERTSSSPSGMNYTIWKCITSVNEMSHYMVIMMRVPFMYGFKNNWWTKCIDVMLEKKVGVRKIYQLRIIGLGEADFNSALKLYFAKQ